MTDDEYRTSLQAITASERSFSVLRNGVGDRPLASSEQIADRLTESIARGSLGPGEPMREQALAEKFKVSRGPIRDALRLLERDGMVTIIPNRGAFVSVFSFDDMRRINDLAKPIGRLLNTRVLQLASEAALADMAAVTERITASLKQGDAIGFALSLATYTLVQAEFALGKTAETVFQLLYRPSIRFTISGIDLPEARDSAIVEWANYGEALHRRDGERAASAVLLMLQALHQPVLKAEQAKRAA